MNESIAPLAGPTGPAASECVDVLSRITLAAADRNYREQQIGDYLTLGMPTAADAFATAVQLVSREAGPVYRPLARHRNLARMQRQNDRALAVMAGGAR